MKFVIPEIDIRTRQNGSTLIEDDRGETVGQLLYQREIGRHVILLGKYSGSFKTHAEAQAFADGVASMLSHMMDRRDVGREGPAVME